MASAVALCPDCNHKVNIKRPRMGQVVTCRNCGTVLEVTETSPLELDWAYFEQEYETEDVGANKSWRNWDDR